MMTINGTTGKWEMVIGLEVHAQVTSKAKLDRVRLLNPTRKLGLVPRRSRHAARH